MCVVSQVESKVIGGPGLDQWTAGVVSSGDLLRFLNTIGQGKINELFKR